MEDIFKDDSKKNLFFLGIDLWKAFLGVDGKAFLDVDFVRDHFWRRVHVKKNKNESLI